MAEEDKKEETLDNEEEKQESLEPEEEKPKKEKKSLLDNKPLLFGIVGLIIVLIIAGGVGAYFLLKKDDSQEVVKPDVNKTIKPKPVKKQEPLPQTKVDSLIKEANELYAKGNKKEALELYETVSAYNESISHYNMGVALMKEKKFKEALESFKTALTYEDNLCVSAINAAVCSLELGESAKFKYYLDLAYAHLPKSQDDPLYAYYYGIIKYYQGEYLESLHAFENDNNLGFTSQKNHLMGHMYMTLNQNIKASELIEKNKNNKDYLTLAMLYSREGDYQTAKEYFQVALNNNIKPDLTKMAMVLNYMKMGDMHSAAQMKELYKKFGDKPTEYFPIRVILSKNIFDKNFAQEKFRKNLDLPDKRIFDILFYFAPYKIFNNNKTIGYIRKGNKSMYIDNISDAKEDFKKSYVSALVSKKIAKAVKYAINYKVRDANKILLEVIEKNPNDSILHYNLGLTFAQLGLYSKAYKYFAKSFHLDPQNSLSGVFAVLSGRLGNLDYEKIMIEVQTHLSNKVQRTNEDILHSAILSSISSGYASINDWLMKESKDDSILSSAFEVIAASKLDAKGYDLQQMEIEKANKLKSMLNDDIIANSLHLYAVNRKLSNKQFAQKANYFLKEHRVHLEQLYYGPVIAREMYIGLSNIAGTTYLIRDILREKLMTEEHDTRGILQALALTNIYLNFFEEAYTLYNQLINNLGEADSNTLLLAAVSAIGANHHSDAISLLKLATIDDKTNYEARYGLGLLYLEAKNLNGTSIQIDRINTFNFKSNYFDFEIIK
jgi:tetratricopeptide (TPR) repeat protein